MSGGGLLPDMRAASPNEPVPYNALELIRNDLSQLELEPGLRNSVREHYRHLEALAASLRKLGINGKAIDQHVSQIFEKYRTELLKNITRLERS
jgi:hypothetical protein